MPPEGNANFAWVQHMVHHLNRSGRMGMVLANGSLSSQTNNEGAIRAKLIEADLVEGVVAMPGQLFYSTQIPVDHHQKEGSTRQDAIHRRAGYGHHGKPQTARVH